MIIRIDPDEYLAFIFKNWKYYSLKRSIIEGLVSIDSARNVRYNNFTISNWKN